MTGNILFQAIVYLASAVLCVPFAKKLGFSSILGYLLAGVIIGPYVLGLVGHEGEDIMHFAEFGVVMMLFLIGLEINPRDFWNMRKTILGMGGLQVGLTMAVTYYLFTGIGYDHTGSLVVAMAVSLSSTAITLQTLKEKDMFNTVYGSSSFSILLFQDIIVIFMLGSLPLLAGSGKGEAQDTHGATVNLLANLPFWLQTLAIFLSVVLIIVIGRYLIVPILRMVSRTRVRELLTAAALLTVVVISYLMELVGLSPALGAFLGGVVLANSEFKHELESTLEPFKALLLGLFFMAVGASINFIVVKDDPITIFGLLLTVIVLKALVLFAVGTLFRLKLDQKLLLAVGLAQIGEFAFVLLSFAFQLQIIDEDLMDVMLVTTALTMAITPVLGLINERYILPNVGTKELEKHPMDHIAKTHKVILVGFGHFGSTVGRFLRAHGIEATILDHDSNRVDLLRKMGFEVYYGDATREELLESAGIESAKFLISSLDNPESTLKLAHLVKKKFPNVKFMVRAKNRDDAYQLIDMGVDDVYRESLDTSVKLAVDVLAQLGFRKYTLYKQAHNFIKLDEQMLRRLAKQPHTDEEYIFKAREEMAQIEKLLEDDFKRGVMDVNSDWSEDDSPA